MVATIMAATITEATMEVTTTVAIIMAIMDMATTAMEITVTVFKCTYYAKTRIHILVEKKRLTKQLTQVAYRK